MPRYVYRCSCGHTAERTCKIDDRDSQSCQGDLPDCPRAASKPPPDMVLNREEIPEVGEAMRHNWSKWAL